jgi:hypothetical protein
MRPGWARSPLRSSSAATAAVRAQDSASWGLAPVHGDRQSLGLDQGAGGCARHATGKRASTTTGRHERRYRLAGDHSVRTLTTRARTGPPAGQAGAPLSSPARTVAPLAASRSEKTTGRPDTTATRRTGGPAGRALRPRRRAGAPVPGSSTIGDSVPSKSVTMAEPLPDRPPAEPAARRTPSPTAPDEPVLRSRPVGSLAVSAGGGGRGGWRSCGQVGAGHHHHLAVPMELIGAAVVYGATAVAGRWSDVAMDAASGWKPAR